MLLTALVLAIGSSLFSSWIVSHAEDLSALVVNGDAIYTGFLIFWSYIILLGPAMPIALYMSLVHNTALIQPKAEEWKYICVSVSMPSHCAWFLNVRVSVGSS